MEDRFLGHKDFSILVLMDESLAVTVAIESSGLYRASFFNGFHALVRSDKPKCNSRRMSQSDTNQLLRECSGVVSRLSSRCLTTGLTAEGGRDAIYFARRFIRNGLLTQLPGPGQVRLPHLIYWK